MDIVKRLREYACVDKTGWADMVLEAADEIERLRQQVATLQGIEAIANEYGVDGFVEIEELRRQVAELRSALKHYGWHEDHCDAINKASDCDCGYDEALARTAKEE